MLAKMIDKIVSLKETKIFEINGQTYADASLTRIPPHVDRPDCISVSGLDSICKLIRTELEKVGTTIMVQVKSNDTVEVMTTYLSDFSRNTLYRAKADAPGLAAAAGRPAYFHPHPLGDDRIPGAGGGPGAGGLALGRRGPAAAAGDPLRL
jgi:hypothetical protein